jgi:hypothetical protein
MTRLLALAALILSPAVALAQTSDVLWRGDFSTGNLSQWNIKQIVSADRIQVVTPPTPHDGMRYAVKVTVKQGDNPISSSGNRNELVNTTTKLPEGSEVYYRWSTMFANNYPSARTWQVFTQWHQPEDYGYPPMQFNVYGEEISLAASQNETKVWSAPLVRGVWQDFILHVRWSDSASVGFIELWHNGKLVLPKRYMKTRANVYLKQGLYRSNTITQDGVLYHTGMVTGRTLASVMPSTTVTQPVSTSDRLWSGNFSTGNTSQWDSIQAQSLDRVQVIQQPVPHENNRYAVKVTVQPADLTAGGNRAQLVRTKLEPEGSDVYYRWSTMFASDYPSVSNSQVFASFNNASDTGAPPIQLRTVGEEIQVLFTPSQRIIWRGPLQRSKWLRFIVHARFSNDPAQGFVELWYDGAQVLGKTYGLTQANDYLKLGLNRIGYVPRTSVVYHDGMVQGRTLASVLPTYVTTN